MLERSALFNHQVDAVNYLNCHYNAMFWGFLGIGKSVITLSSIVDRMTAGQIRGVLVIAPIRVCHAVWEKEAKKWAHTQGLTFSVIHGGSPKKRKSALFKKVDIHLINYEGLAWLTQVLIDLYIDRGREIPWNMCVYDEVAEMKNSESVRMKVTSSREVVDKKGVSVKVIKKGWRNIVPFFDYTVGLTGTPSSNGYEDLFGQYLCVDKGERLGKFITHYRDAYFQQSQSGWGQVLVAGGKERVEAKIADITLSMSTPSEYQDLPDVVYKNMYVTLPPKAMAAYIEVEKEMYAQLDSGVEVEVFCEIALTTKLAQIANGAVYVDVEKDKDLYEVVHDAKLDALEEVLVESAGVPVVVLYQYRSDVARILKRFKSYKPVCLSGVVATRTGAIIKKVQSGDCKLIMLHSKLGHGIDGLQDACCVLVWLGVGNNLGGYLQANGRVNRTGQKKVVSIIHILAETTVDDALLCAIERKDTSQDALKRSLQENRFVR